VQLVLPVWVPENVEFSLLHVVTNPIKMHIDGLGVLLFDGVIDDAACSAVICSDGGCWLGVAKFIQSGADGASSLGIEKECTKFSFGSTGHNLSHDLTQDVNGIIVQWHKISGSGYSRWTGTKEVIVSGMGPAFGG